MDIPGIETIFTKSMTLTIEKRMEKTDSIKFCDRQTTPALSADLAAGFCVGAALGKITLKQPLIDAGCSYLEAISNKNLEEAVARTYDFYNLTRARLRTANELFQLFIEQATIDTETKKLASNVAELFFQTTIEGDE
ncbi:hypothetical protein [Pelosinus sp. sgz500959]|uniref:hypothetical protein n=1 Tax=Pelosinus sp. sgz500959 TaxID=3242472 RepID=UPI003670345F